MPPLPKDVAGPLVGLVVPSLLLLGGGAPERLAALASALAGTWLYGYLRPHLPH